MRYGWVLYIHVFRVQQQNHNNNKNSGPLCVDFGGKNECVAYYRDLKRFV